MSSTEGLVGREAELALAAAAVRRLSEGRASVLVIEGEAGIGKTRLVQSIIDDARSRDVAVYCGQPDLTHNPAEVFGDNAQRCSRPAGGSDRRIGVKEEDRFPRAHRRAERPVRQGRITDQLRVALICCADDMIKEMMHGWHGNVTTRDDPHGPCATFAMRPHRLGDNEQTSDTVRVLEHLRSAAEMGLNGSFDDALHLMAVVKTGADLQILGNRVEEEPGADRLPTKHGESLVTVRAGPIVVWDRETFDL